jgi:diaminopimelate decarboxylase
LEYKLPIEPVTLLQIADQFGTPVYVYDEHELERRARQLLQVFNTSLPVSWLYAIKANDNPHLLERIAAYGFGFDTVSSEEMHLALAFQPDRERIFYTENNMTDAEMEAAYHAGVVLNIGSYSRLEQFCAHHPGASVCIRVNPEIGDGHHEKVVTGHKESKFGIGLDKLDQVRALCARSQVKLLGLHIHIGSGIQVPSNMVKAIEKLIEIAKPFDTIKFLNFGGGFPIPYKQEDQEFDFKEMASLVEPLLLAEWNRRNQSIHFYFEPGRYLVASSGMLLTRVNAIKEQGDVTYLGCDTGFNHLIRPALYGAWHELVNLNRFDAPAQVCYSLAGNICESGDILAHDRMLPQTHMGDVLAIADAGAYGMVMASMYNRRPLPPEILHTLQGEKLCIRKRWSMEEVLAEHHKQCNYPPK